MEIIGEKINGTRKRVARALSEQDAVYIQDLARSQAEAGADWIDLNAGSDPAQEPDSLLWLVEKVQAVIDTPLSLDSVNPKALIPAIKAVQKTPIINSISGEQRRLESILPIAAEYGCRIIALALDDVKIPETSEGRLEIVHKVISATRKAGIPDTHVYVDPLVMTISSNTQSGLVFLNTLKIVHTAYPDVHLTAGLSNISFGLPARALINRTFLTLAIGAGLDSAICDPIDTELKAALLSTELLLGKDKYCMNYIQAFRNGIFK